jgi:hypothetical protein
MPQRLKPHEAFLLLKPLLLPVLKGLVFGWRLWARCFGLDQASRPGTWGALGGGTLTCCRGCWTHVRFFCLRSAMAILLV